MNIESHQLPSFEEPSENQKRFQEAHTLDMLAIAAQEAGYPEVIASLIMSAKNDPLALSKISQRDGLYDRVVELIEESKKRDEMRGQ